MASIADFQEEHPSLESYWQSILLFGRNVASYKVALSKALLELAGERKPKWTCRIWRFPSQSICVSMKLMTFGRGEVRKSG